MLSSSLLRWHSTVTTGCCTGEDKGLRRMIILMVLVH